MEYGLRVMLVTVAVCYLAVLILVLMEYGLRARKGWRHDPLGVRLNPCFNGIWSKSDGMAGQERR